MLPRRRCHCRQAAARYVPDCQPPTPAAGPCCRWPPPLRPRRRCRRPRMCAPSLLWTTTTRCTGRPVRLQLSLVFMGAGRCSGFVLLGGGTCRVAVFMPAGLCSCLLAVPAPAGQWDVTRGGVHAGLGSGTWRVAAGSVGVWSHAWLHAGQRPLGAGCNARCAQRTATCSACFAPWPPAPSVCSHIHFCSGYYKAVHNFHFSLCPHLPFFAGYYEAVHNFHRRQLAPDELRLVSAGGARG